MVRAQITAILPPLRLGTALAPPPCWRVHKPRGDRAGTWSFSVSGNWRLTFDVRRWNAGGSPSEWRAAVPTPKQGGKIRTQADARAASAARGARRGSPISDRLFIQQARESP